MNKLKMMSFGFSMSSSPLQNKKVWEMTSEEVQQYCREGRIREVANVGDTFGDGTFTYTIIGIDQDMPCDENGNPLDPDSYKDVLTVMCLGAPVGPGNERPVIMDTNKTPLGSMTAPMNNSATTRGSWKATKMRSETMSLYLEKLPAETQKVIGYVQKITGQCDCSRKGDSNITTVDKCFLLSGKELFGGSTAKIISYCTKNEVRATFQYQYFEKIATSPRSRDIQEFWWLRSPNYYYDDCFCGVNSGSFGKYFACVSNDVFPAFCIY